MLSTNDIIKIIQQVALAAVEQSDPAGIVYGTVESVDSSGSPNKIKIDQQWEIDGDQIVVPNSFKDKKYSQIKVKGKCISQLHELLDKEGISYMLDDGCGKDEALVDVNISDSLKAGDKVIISTEQGGQRFIISGRT